MNSFTLKTISFIACCHITLVKLETLLNWKYDLITLFNFQGSCQSIQLAFNIKTPINNNSFTQNYYFKYMMFAEAKKLWIKLTT